MAIHTTVKKLSVFAGIIIVITFIYSIGSSPVHKINRISQWARNDQAFLNLYDSAYNHPSLIPLVREKVYKDALLKLSENDSIQLIVNLHDSTINLSIKGIIIHKTKITSFRVDRLLKKLPNMEYVKMFSNPVFIHSQYATIVKEPIVERDAPKDTIEASLNAYEPDTLIQKPAFLQMETEFGINFIIEQDNNKGIKNRAVKFLFETRIFILKVYGYMKNFVSLRKQDYKPVIQIKMPVNDLRAIYRAMPHKSYMVVYYDAKL